MKQCARRWALILLASCPTALGAQLAPVTIPRGLFRLELGGEFRNADSRYNAGVTEDLARSFTAIPLGPGFFAAPGSAESGLGAILGNASYRLNLGRSTANGLRNIGTATIGLSYGLSSRLTLFAAVPIVRTRMQLSFRLDSTGADAGLNPGDPVLGTPAGRAQTGAFLGEFDAALSTLAANIASGMYDGNPQQRAQADQALADGTALRAGFEAAFNDPASPFVPTGTSGTGAAIVDTVSSYQATLSGLGVTGFASTPALATAPLSQDDFTNLLTSPGGPIQGFPLEEATLNLLGDIEAGISWLVQDRWYRGGEPGGFRAAVTGAIRLPTGEVDLPANFLDVGTGSGHLVARVTGTVDLGRGRIGARVMAGYEHGFAADLDQRVAGPFQPVPLASRLARVRRQPGGTLDVAVAPFFRLGSTLALTGGLRYRRRSRDAVTYGGTDLVPGLAPASLLAEATDWTLATVQGGVTYMSPAAVALGQPGFPVEASWTIEGPVSGGGGIVAKERVMRVQFRMYLKL